MLLMVISLGCMALPSSRLPISAIAFMSPAQAILTTRSAMRCSACGCPLPFMRRFKAIMRAVRQGCMATWREPIPVSSRSGGSISVGSNT